MPDPAHVQRDTASDGMTRAWTQPKWRDQQQRRVRLAGQGRRALASPLLRRTSRQRGFESRTRRHQQKSPCADAPRGLQTGRNDWAAPEPVTGIFMRLSICLVNSVIRVPACLVGSRGFESRTRRQTRVSLARLDQSAGLRSRRSHVRVVHETPFSSRRSQAAEGVWLQPRGRKPASVRSVLRTGRSLLRAARPRRSRAI